MVKPHSPIAECRSKSSPLIQSSKKESMFCRTDRIDSAGASSPKPKLDGLQTRRVSFSKKVNVKETLHINDMSDKVRNRYWLTEEEQSDIKNHCLLIIQKMKSHDQDIDTEDCEFCTRGLESRTRQGRDERSRRKYAVRRAVLLQEKLQRDEGIYDPDFIAAVGALKTKESVNLAYVLARRDAEEAWQYLHCDLC